VPPVGWLPQDLQRRRQAYAPGEGAEAAACVAFRELPSVVSGMEQENSHYGTVSDSAVVGPA
jgi:hypothetical protein